MVQTARAFLNGYLYEYADSYGTVVSVNSTGSPAAIGNSLGPSDSCPAFSSISSGGNNVTNCKFNEENSVLLVKINVPHLNPLSGAISLTMYA